MAQTAGFFDCQVNGYAGVDFNADDLDGQALHSACEQLRADGVNGILATIITDSLDRMSARLAKLAALRRSDPLVREVIAGLHVEGPFICPEQGYVGTHPVAHVLKPSVDTMRRLLDAADGLARIVTLAPEKDEDLRITRMLADSGIVVAAGHCNPTTDQLRGAIDAGLTMFTHLGNGCPAMLPRHDNVVQRVLAMADRLFISFIADGAHVPFVALGNYLRLVPTDHVVIVSDAINAAGRGPGTYAIGNQTVEVGEDLVPRADDNSHFVGSACTMQKMAANLQRELGATDEQIQQWFVENPHRSVGIIQ